jgi:hypothetical protein
LCTTCFAAFDVLLVRIAEIHRLQPFSHAAVM